MRAGEAWAAWMGGEERVKGDEVGGLFKRTQHNFLTGLLGCESAHLHHGAPAFTHPFEMQRAIHERLHRGSVAARVQ